MIEVKKCYIDYNYLNDYWKKNVIIDQSKQYSCSNNNQINNNQINNNQINNNPNKNLNRLTIDVNSYNDFKIFVDNLNELTDELETNILTSNYTESNLNNGDYIESESEDCFENEESNENKDFYEINKKEKLNYNYKVNISVNTNDFRKQYVNSFRNSVPNKSNSSRRNSIYYSKEGSCRNQISNFRMHNKQKSCENRILHEHVGSNKDKGKMYKLPKNCRIYEYETRERKILLDSFSKPKLIKNF